MKSLVSLLLAGCVMFSAGALYAVNFSGPGSWGNVVSQKPANTKPQTAEFKKNAGCESQVFSSCRA